MCGTSLDGIDAALVAIHGNGLTMSVEMIDSASIPMPPDLHPRLRALAAGEARSLEALLAIEAEISQAHVHVIRELMAGGSPVDFIAAHGQTVHHAPPLSCQLLDPSVITHATGRPVVSDLRAADLAAGGQGAPITPIADAILFGDFEHRRAVINLGGFCNVTSLPAWTGHPGQLESIRAGDLCACNHVLDEIARVHLGTPFDEDGAAAMSGAVDASTRDHLIGCLRAQRDARRSLGSGDEMHDWARDAAVEAAILAASACAAIGGVIGETVASWGTDEIILAGGGSRNHALSRALADAASKPVIPIDSLVPNLTTQDRESVCMAILGALCEDHIAITLSQVTGVREPAPVAGVWTHA